jgi:hypothetical protein
MATKPSQNLTLIASNSKNPIGKSKPGTKLQVVSVTLAGTASGKRPKIGARLCGGTSTCLVLVQREMEKQRSSLV